jgi:DNA-directed RNA polymerase specialized sigma24 family protein
LLLADVEERSHREIAERCELPLGTVMSRLFRARRLLRKTYHAARRRVRPAAGEWGRGARG